MYLAVPTAVSKASVFSIGLECATGTCSHSHSHSRSALPKYFITSPWSRCSLSLSLSLTPLFLALFISISLPFFFLSPFLFNRRKKLFAVMSSCKVRLIVVTMFLTLKLLFETSTSKIHGLSKIDDLPSGNYRSIRQRNIFHNQSTPKNRSGVSSAEIWKRCISSSDITRFTLPTSMKLSGIEVNAFY